MNKLNDIYSPYLIFKIHNHECTPTNMARYARHTDPIDRNRLE